MDFQIQPYGERAFCIVFSADNETPDLLPYIHACTTRLKAELGAIDVIPATESITVVLDKPLQLSEIQAVLNRLFNQARPAQVETIHQHEIPVCYDPRLAPDLVDASDKLGMSIERLIELHSSAQYRLDMLGFLPGFLYLSGLPDELVIARKDTPVISVPAGSIAIAGNQSGLYSLSSPGGWWVIGRTPNCLFDANQTPPIALSPMDRVRFRQISYDQWQSHYDH
jgi:inhibitor of KinA